MIDKMRAAIEEIVGEYLWSIDTHALYPGTVKAQHADGSMDVALDDPRFGPGPMHVPYRAGIPGATVTVPVGARVCVGFEAHRRDLPRIHAFGEGTPITVKFDASSNITIEASEVTLAGGATGASPTEHATSAEAVVNLIVSTLVGLANTYPGPWIGAAIAAGTPVAMNATLAAASAASIAPYAVALNAALAAKTPNTTGLVPNVGWPNVRGG